MFLLALHIIVVGILVVGVWSVAHRAGMRKGERVLRRRLGLDESAPGAIATATGTTGAATVATGPPNGASPESAD